MSRANITWRSETEEGEKCEVYAEKIGDRWLFHWRAGRYEEWRPYSKATLEDWLILLDNVQRRIKRRWFRPEEEGRMLKKMVELYGVETLEGRGVVVPEELGGHGEQPESEEE